MITYLIKKDLLDHIKSCFFISMRKQVASEVFRLILIAFVECNVMSYYSVHSSLKNKDPSCNSVLNTYTLR